MGKVRKFGKKTMGLCGCCLVKCKICNPYFYGGTIELFLHVVLTKDKKGNNKVYVNGREMP